MKKGFATSAILYTILLLFIVLLIGILSNLQNKKVILDALKEETVKGLECCTVTEAILDQVTIINNKIIELEKRIAEIGNIEWDDISGKPITFTPTAHNHDDRYYVQSAINLMLAQKASTNHTHAWSEITGKPLTYTPTAHTHDDRYYTETEIDTKLKSYMPISGGTFTGDISMDRHKLNLITPSTSGAAWIDATTQDINIINQLSSTATYINLRAAHIQARNPENTAWTSMSAASFNTQSSIRYKENVQDIPLERARKILDVAVKTYDYKDNVVSDHQYDRTGVIAEEVEKIIPEVVSYSEENGEKIVDGVDYAKFVPYLIEMIQIQQKTIEEQQENQQKLDERISYLENIIAGQN